jgi:hypothetical protein
MMACTSGRAFLPGSRNEHSAFFIHYFLAVRETSLKDSGYVEFRLNFIQTMNTKLKLTDSFISPINDCYEATN